MSNLTVSQTLEAIRALRVHGITVARVDGEWRIRLNGDANSDYFTSDNEDAIDTARAMAARALGAVKVSEAAPDGDSADGWYFTLDAFCAPGSGVAQTAAFVGPYVSRDAAQAAASEYDDGRVAGQYDIGELSKIAANPEGFYYRAVWLVPTPGSVAVQPPAAQAEPMVEVTAPGGERRTLTLAGVRSGLTRAIGADEAADVLAMLLAFPGKPQTVLTRQLQAVTFRLIPA